MPSFVISQDIRHIMGMAIIGIMPGMPIIIPGIIPPPIMPGMPPIIPGIMPGIIPPPIMPGMPMPPPIIGMGIGIIIGIPPDGMPPIIGMPIDGIALIGVIAAPRARSGRAGARPEYSLAARQARTRA
ncbi:MAG TPA: hypothetical protein VFP65_04140 [Anaeromyxobacteraceae bacterium]|nr:hypothetical protein [Anaeromyxobacteraceae bacterium]